MESEAQQLHLDVIRSKAPPHASSVLLFMRAWHDPIGSEASVASRGNGGNSKGRLQEEYERGLVQIGRAASMRGLLQLWGLLSHRALGPPVNVAVCVGGCSPLWEDPVNRRGGHFAVRNIAGRTQAVELFKLLLRSLDQQQPQRGRRPVGALLSTLTGVVLCLRTNDRGHKVEVWVGSTNPHTLRQQEAQLRELLNSGTSVSHRLDMGFLSHEVCLCKNQRKADAGTRASPDGLPSTSGSVSTDTGSSHCSSSREGFCDKTNDTVINLSDNTGLTHPSYKSVILMGSSSGDQLQSCSARAPSGACEPLTCADGASSVANQVEEGRRTEAENTKDGNAAQGKRLGRQKQQRRPCEMEPRTGGLFPEQRLLQHLYAFDARELPDYFSMQQAAYQGRVAMYESYAACASAAITSEYAAATVQQQQQGECTTWDFPPLKSSVGTRVHGQKQHHRQFQLDQPCASGYETRSSSSSTTCSTSSTICSTSSTTCSNSSAPAVEGTVAQKRTKQFAFNPNAPGFVMPTRPTTSIPLASGKNTAAEARRDCTAATPAELSEPLLQPEGVAVASSSPLATLPTGEDGVRLPVPAAASEEPGSVSGASAAAVAAQCMGSLFDADFVDPRDPSSLLLITLMLTPALDDASPLHVPLLPLSLLEGEGSSAAAENPEAQCVETDSRLSLTLDYEELTQTLSLDIVQN
ncbi:hypothetical protein cyc_08226 [Cyclospora cayetanensis]|uniref:Uncharacterized protein n=1 Tax=Cyclospora cayetanensis TaxID=88456 RepID=A0A1D3CX61_9EIME|nr:hypothetical protein cyc_08226 [Cyclospora cayetanensis]